MLFSSCLAIVSVVMVGWLFLWPALQYGTGYQTVWEIRPSAETPSSNHWRRFYFQLTRVHSALELSGWCALQIYLLTYLCIHYLSLDKFHNLYQLSPIMLCLACNISRDRYHPVWSHCLKLWSFTAAVRAVRLVRPVPLFFSLCCVVWFVTEQIQIDRWIAV